MSLVRPSVSYDRLKYFSLSLIKIQASNSWLTDCDTLANSALIPNILCASLQMSHEGGVCAIIPKEFMQSQEFFYVLF